MSVSNHRDALLYTLTSPPQGVSKKSHGRFRTSQAKVNRLQSLTKLFDALAMGSHWARLPAEAYRDSVKALKHQSVKMLKRVISGLDGAAYTECGHNFRGPLYLPLLVFLAEFQGKNSMQLHPN